MDEENWPEDKDRSTYKRRWRKRIKNNVKYRIDNTTDSTNAGCAVSEVKQPDASLVNVRNWHNTNEKDCMTMLQEWSVGISVETLAFKEQRHSVCKPRKESQRKITMIEYDHLIRHKKPDVIVVHKKDKKTYDNRHSMSRWEQDQKESSKTEQLRRFEVENTKIVINEESRRNSNSYCHT